MKAQRKQYKILLIHAPFRDFLLSKNWRKMESLAPPLGLMYLAAPLLKEGYKVELIDFNIDKLSKKKFRQKVLSSDFIGISCYSDSLKNVKEIIKFIRNVKKGAFIFCGGPYCNLTGNFIEGANLITRGEAETYISDVIKKLITKKPLLSIPGLVYKDGRKIVKTRGIMRVEELDKSILPDLSLAKNKDYGHFFGLKIPNLIGIMSSRGCPFDCSYCTHNQGQGAKYRERSVKNVIAEIKDLVYRGYKYLIFYDDNFLMNRPRVEKIMDEIIRQKWDLKIICQGRVDSGNEAFYQKLRLAGVAMIMFGVESANQDVLDFYNKRIKIETIKKAVDLANKVGILTFGYFIIGAPMETKEYFKNDLEFINKIKLDFVNINILGYYQGAKLWQDAYSKGLIKKDETIVWANEKLANFSYIDLCKIKEKMIRDIYLDPKRLLRVIYKAYKLDELHLLIEAIMKINKHFLTFINNPFVPKKKLARVIVN